jgi:hypothetical protein
MRILLSILLIVAAAVMPAAELGLGPIPALAGGSAGASGQVLYSNGAQGTSDSGFTRGTLALTVDASSDGAYTFGYSKCGFASGGTATRACWYNSAVANPNVNAAFMQDTTGQTIVNGGTGQNLLLRQAAGTKVTIAGASVTFASGVTVNVTDDVVVTSAGKGIKIKEGSNARMGNATLVAGTVTVSNTSVTANTRIFLQHATTGGTPGHLTYTKSAATSFTITSTSGTDTSTVDWLLVEPAP